MLVLGQLGPEAAEDAVAGSWEEVGRAVFGRWVQRAEDELGGVHFVKVLEEGGAPGCWLRRALGGCRGHGAGWLLKGSRELREAGGESGSYGCRLLCEKCAEVERWRRIYREVSYKVLEFTSMFYKVNALYHHDLIESDPHGSVT